MSYYPSYRSSSNNIKVELDIDLSNYAAKDDVKKVEDEVDENERGLSFNRGFFFYLQKIIMYMNVNQVHLILLFLLIVVLILK